MCPGTRPLPAIPTETAQAVRSVYNLQHVYVRIGDELGSVQAATNLPMLDSTSRLDEDTLFRLALVTAFQYAEDMTEFGRSHRQHQTYGLEICPAPASPPPGGFSFCTLPFPQEFVPIAPRTR